MNEDIRINVAQAEQNITLLNKHADNLEAALSQINDLVVNGGLDHWGGDAKDTFLTEHAEIAPKLRACVDFTRDQARVITEVKEAFQGIRIAKG
jgi:uncharacterized protein YukE